MWNYEWRSRAFVLSVELGNCFLAVMLQHWTHSFLMQPLQIRVPQYWYNDNCVHECVSPSYLFRWLIVWETPRCTSILYQSLHMNLVVQLILIYDIVMETSRYCRIVSNTQMFHDWFWFLESLSEPKSLSSSIEKIQYIYQDNETLKCIVNDPALSLVVSILDDTGQENDASWMIYCITFFLPLLLAITVFEQLASEPAFRSYERDQDN